MHEKESVAIRNDKPISPLRVRSPFLGLGLRTEFGCTATSDTLSSVHTQTHACILPLHLHHAHPMHPRQHQLLASDVLADQEQRSKCCNEPRIFLSPTPVPRESQLTAQFSSILTMPCHCMAACLKELPESRIAVTFFQARKSEEALD